MSNAKRTVLSPQYMKKFRCTCAECEDTCCIGWRIEVDNETLAKHDALTDKSLVKNFRDHIQKQGAVESEWAPLQMVLDKRGRCSYLNDDFLCQIHGSLGEDFLPQICANFPRTINRLKNDIERSASVSCPEIARLALLGTEPMEFDQSEEIAGGRDIVKFTVDDDISFSDLWTLRGFVFPLLQNRSFAIWERLIILGLFCQKIQQLTDAKTGDLVPDAIASYTKMLTEPGLKAQLNDIPVKPAIQMQLLVEIVALRNSSGSFSPRYLECYESFLRGLGHSDPIDMTALVERYAQASVEYYQPFMQTHEHILENYFVNLAFRGLFPFTDGKPVFDNYIKLALQYALLKMLLVGIAADEENFSENSVVRLVYTFSRAVDHHSKFLDDVLARLKNNNMDTMPYISIILKSDS